MIEEQLSEKELAFISELEKYQDKWVAILRDGDNETIVGSGERLRDAKHDAEANGFKEVVFLKVPSSHRVLIPRVDV